MSIIGARLDSADGGAAVVHSAGEKYPKCRVIDKVPVPEGTNRVMQICHSEGNAKIDYCQIVKDKIRVRVLWNFGFCISSATMRCHFTPWNHGTIYASGGSAGHYTGMPVLSSKRHRAAVHHHDRQQ